MALQCGIVGLPNVGKSTLFNCLSNAKAQAANFPFCTIEPNVGVITVPDERLSKLTELVQPKAIVPNTIEIVDIAGLVKGASKGEGLGNQFLGNIRTTNAILHVLRCFDNDNVIHVDGSVDPIRDKEIIDTELQLKDLDSIEKKIQKVEKMAKTGGDKDAKKTFEERQMFLDDMGLTESGVNKLIKEDYKLLKLGTYFTAGVQEVRAWTITMGYTAPQAAGVIHTDFEKGFIRAEVIKYDDFVKYGSEAACKEAGKLSVEGKTYIVEDGDIMHFRFNV